MNDIEQTVTRVKGMLNAGVEAIRQEKKTIRGHCEICNAWTTLHPVREADPGYPGDTAVVAKCIRCLPARPPEPRRD